MLFDLLSLGNVHDDAEHLDGVSGRIEGQLPAAMHPALGLVLASNNPILPVKPVMLFQYVALQILGHGGPIFRVDEVEPP